MAKARNTAFFCKECGYESAKWLGQCPVCKEWNTFVQEPVAQTKKAYSRTDPAGRSRKDGGPGPHLGDFFGGAGQDAYGLWRA